MKIFKDSITKSNFLVFIFFLILTIISFTLSGCRDEVKPIIIHNKKTMDSTDVFGPVLPGEKDVFDFSQSEGVSDTLIYGDWEPDVFVSDSIYFININYIDSIKKIKK